MSTAVVKTGGKQYVVSEGSSLRVDKLAGKEGDKVKLEVLLKADDKNDKVEIGSPKLSGTIEATIVKQGRDKKITVTKYKNKTRYKRTIGHKQDFTELKIDKI